MRLPKIQSSVNLMISKCALYIRPYKWAEWAMSKYDLLTHASQPLLYIAGHPLILPETSETSNKVQKTKNLKIWTEKDSNRIHNKNQNKMAQIWISNKESKEEETGRKEMLHFLPSLQLRLLLASLPHHPFHLRQPHDQVDQVDQPNNQLIQPLEHLNQPNQQKDLDRLNYQYFPSLDLTYRPQQTSYQTAEHVFTPKGVEKVWDIFLLANKIYFPPRWEGAQTSSPGNSMEKANARPCSSLYSSRRGQPCHQQRIHRHKEKTMLGAFCILLN